MIITFVPGKGKKESDNNRHTLLHVEENNTFWNNLCILTKNAISQKIASIKKGGVGSWCFSFVSEQFIGGEQAVQCCSEALNSNSSRLT